jgi:hypothetical protein
MGANYSTSYVKSTANAFLMAQEPSQSRLHQYGEDGIETRGYSKLTGLLKKYVECIEFVVKNPKQLHVKMNELAHIRTNIRELMNQYKVPESFTFATKYKDVEGQISKQMYAMMFGRKRRSKRSNFGRKRTSYRKHRV